MSGRETTGAEIAVIGLAGRFPGAHGLAAFWDNLRRGVESIARFTPDELEPAPLLPPDAARRAEFVPAGAVLDPPFVESFDAELFGLTPREAQWTDPQQRLLLECAFAALEDAGCDPQHQAGKIAFYAGVGHSGHQLALLAQARREPAALFEALGTAAAENTAMRVAYKLRLRGESLSVYSACSTGLVVVHLACQSLLLRQSDVALAGAAKVALPQRTGYLYQDGMILSPDGRCRPFAEDAAGTVPGHGAGVVVLKRLADALRDGDHVYAVVLGSAVNNDAGAKVGYTAPGVTGQAEVVGEALRFAEVSADSIGYVEAHGTGTRLGDPIEAAALTRAFRSTTERRGFCALGSVKGNIGHLDTAAGMAGFMKAVLALHHGEIPPSLHAGRTNPAIDFAASPFFVPGELRPWPRGERPRRAGVSSFGIGGTNAHAVLEEAPAPPPAQASRRTHQLVTLSARTPTALQVLAGELAEHLDAHPELDPADVAFTRNTGRRAFAERRAVVASDRAALAAELRRAGRLRTLPDDVRPRVAFLFPGQGAQSAAMGAELYRREDVFRDELDACAERLRPQLERDVREVLYGDGAADAALTCPALALPCLFAVEYALARLWMSWGVVPEAGLGHSFGEYVAACLSGVLTLDDALRLAVLRGELMRRLPEGAMLAVALDEDELRPQLGERLALAAVNARRRSVVSGPVDAVDALERSLTAAGHGVLRLPVRRAFHSADVDAAVPELRAALATLRLRPPQRPYVSSLTGAWIRDDEAVSPDYWARQMREPVRFAAGLETLAQAGVSLYVEAGPDQALSALVRAHFDGGTATACPSLRRAGSAGSDEAVLLRSLGELWCAGHDVGWDAFYAGERRRRVPLPAYPFERQPCRLEAVVPIAEVLPSAAAGAAPTPPPGAGTVDRAAAPEPELDDVERRVAEIWRERLGVEHVGRHDNFLELGGNSLMAAQVLTRLREVFAVALPLADLFEAPTLAELSARIAARLREHGVPGAGARVEPLVPVPRTGELPPSVVQQRVLAVARREPENPALNMPAVVRLVGALDVAVLERAAGEIVARHEVLRTTWREHAGRFVAGPAAPAALPLAAVDLRAHADPRAEAQRLARAEAARPFDLLRGVVRAGLLRLSEDEHWLLLTIHHVACDTWSLVAFMRELLALYRAFCAGEPSPLPPLPVQYADFAAWQERALAGGAFEPQRGYWKQRLEPRPAPLDLPLDRPRPVTPSFAGGRLLFRFPRRLTDAVHAFGDARGATPFMTVLAAFKALLQRWSGRHDVVVGTPVGNRSRGELEPLIGYVAHSLPLRTDLSGGPSFEEAVARVRETTLAAYAHPDYPYEALLREGGADLGRGRLFDAVFVLQGRFDAPEIPGLRAEVVEVPGGPVQWGATLAHFAVSMGEDEQGFFGTVEYDTEIFEEATAARLVAQLEHLLAAGLARPHEHLAALPLVSEDETRALAARAPAAVPPASAEPAPLFGRLDGRAARTPDEPALVAEDGTLGFAELLARAADVAAALARHGAGPGVPVGVSGAASAARAVAQLGVLRAGAAFVLLGPDETLDGLALRLTPDASAPGGVAVTRATPPPGDAPPLPAPSALACLVRVDATARLGLTYANLAHIFAALDALAESTDEPGAWLVSEDDDAGLEALWALARGRTAVLPRSRGARFVTLGAAGAPARGLQLGLSFFANDEDRLGGAKYALLLEGARRADRLGLAAVWTPERHFHAFGGLYPSPAVVAGALAAATERIGIRAGSVVLPLHDPLRVAEEWAVADNLSGGRVGVSFASGWNASDFVFAPDTYARRRQVLLEGLEVVRALWRGAALRRRSGSGDDVEVHLRPRPVQPELPVWLTAARSPDTFRLAGELGAGILTNLMGQALEDLEEKIALYRRRCAGAGHAGRGHVTLMMHTFLGGDEREVRALVREPLLAYFTSSVDIFRAFAASQGLDVDVSTLARADVRALVEHGFDRYFETAGLFGTADSCQPMLDRVAALDVDEVACLIDFGVALEPTLDGIERLALALARRRERQPAGAAAVLVAAGDAARVRARRPAALPADVAAERALTGLLWRGAAEVWVLDGASRPLPPGVVGQLAVAGDAQPWGFWGGERQSAAARVPHPAGNGTLWATGQCARVERDGRLTPLGPLPTAPARPPAPAAAHDGTAPIPRVARTGELPLSFAQQRLFYLDQLDPGSAAYNNPVALRLTGRLDVPALERAFDEVVRRHEVLRTRLVVRGGQATQQVLPELHVVFTHVDLGAHPAQDREAETLRRARDEAARPFDLTQAPLVRATLLRLGDEEHVLLVTMHHVVSDGWSAGVLFTELGTLYAAFGAGRPSPLPELPVQYGDYAVWQRRRLQGPRLERELSYWTTRLADLPALELPADRPPTPQPSHRGARQPVVMPKALTQALAAAARREGATLFMGLMAIFQALLQRYSGQEDFGVGTPVAGRTRPELEPLVGCFVNTLVLRAGLTGRPSLRELLRRVRQDALGAFAHAELPFERLVDALGVPRDLARPAVVQTMLILHNTPQPRAELRGVRLEGLPVDSGTAKFDLGLELRETGGEVRGDFEYAADRFDAGTLARLAENFVALAQAALADPDRPLNDLPLLADAQRRQVLTEWNGTAAPYPSERCLHELFAEQARRTPAAPAVVSPHEGLTLSYADLDRQADVLAGRLRAYGVGPDACVGLCLHRSVAEAVAVLGVLKAGGAYVPLDADWPRERLAGVVQDAGLRLVLAARELADVVPAGTAPVVCLEELRDAAGAASPVGPRPCPDNLAYVVTTSGSTGRPKGVAVPHRGVVRLAYAGDGPRWSAGDAALRLAPLTFDVSSLELWGPLLAGARVVLAPPGKPSPEELGALVRAQGVTVLALPAGLFALMVDEQLAALRGVRQIVAGGDVLPPAHARRLLDAQPGLALFNGYGPTEASTQVSVHRVTPACAPVPIGRPMANTRLYVLDAHGQPVPAGVPGELCIGGDALARGYHGRPDLTAAAFVPDAWSGTPGARLYRSGDRARWRADGTLEFLGRLDRQVKVRGFRIEPGEIEAALVRHPQVREALAVAREDVPGERRLVAYVVSAGADNLDVAELRAFLARHVPEPMLPAAFVPLAALPLTPTGKIDRRALPAPEGRPELRTAFVAPRTPAEATLAGIWAQLLRLGQVGVHDNFFALGGDSILSLQLVARARRQGLVLSPRQVFQHQTVAEQAAAAGAGTPIAAEQGTVTGAVPLTPVQHFFFGLSLAEPQHFNLSVALDVAPELDGALLDRALAALVRHHDALRLRFHAAPEGWRQELAPAEDRPLVTRVPPGALAADAEAALFDAHAARFQAGFDLSRGPLVRAALFERGPGRAGRLMIFAHHLVVDAVSWRVLLEDLALACGQLERGEAVQLLPKTTSFKHWAERLVEHAHTSEAAAELPYWEAQVDAAALRLPVDFADGDNTVASAAGVEVQLEADVTRALLHDVPATQHTRVLDVLLAALGRALCAWTGRAATAVDVETHGRAELGADVDLSRTVGWFTAHHPLRLELRRPDDLGASLRAVKEQVRAVPNLGVGYGLLRHVVRAPRLTALGAPELAFNYVGQIDAAPGDGRLQLAGMPSTPRSPRGRRAHILDVEAAVLHGRLQIVITYSRALHRRDTAEVLARSLLDSLRALVAHVLSDETAAYSAADFPDAELSQEELDRFLAGLGSEAGA